MFWNDLVKNLISQLHNYIKTAEQKHVRVVLSFAENTAVQYLIRLDDIGSGFELTFWKPIWENFRFIRKSLAPS